MVAFGQPYGGNGRRRASGCSAEDGKELVTYAYQYDREGNRILTDTATPESKYTYEYCRPCSTDDSGDGSSARRDREAEAVEQVLATDDCAGGALWGLGDQPRTIRDVVFIIEALTNHVEHVGCGAASVEISVVRASADLIDTEAATALLSSTAVCIMEAFDLWHSDC